MPDKQNYSHVILDAVGLCLQGDVQAAYEYCKRQGNIGQQEAQFTQQLHDRFLIDDPTYGGSGI